MRSAALDDLPSLRNLLDVTRMRELCRSVGDLYGIGIKLFDLDGTKIVDVRATTSEHCGYLFSIHATRTRCTALVGEITHNPLTVEGGVRTVDCFSGLRYRIVPLALEGGLVGRMVFGPYAPSDAAGPPASLGREFPDLDLAVLRDLRTNVTRAAEPAVEQVIDNLTVVVHAIIEASHRTWVTTRMHLASIGTAFDDLKRTNRELKQANARLVELDQLKSNFVAMVSHELRTPLTSVIGYAEMLLEGMAGELTDEQRDYIRTILEKGESLLGLIVQVLDLARIESGNAQLQKRATDPRTMVELAVSDVAPMATKQGLKVEMRVDGDLPPIEVDADKIRRVVSNLLANAVKFTPPQGRVMVRVEVIEAPPVGRERFDIFDPERNRYLRLSVTDTGVGIPEDKVERVFDAFFQVDNSSTRKFGGTGLGLSIARAFVEAHHGRIDVTSRPGQGSTFTVLLPYRPQAPEEAAGVDGLADDTLPGSG